MRHTSKLNLLAGVLALAGIAGSGAASANPLGVTYQVLVKTSFGTEFTDCLSFDKKGNLTVGGYGTLEYAFQNLGTNKKRFQSVPPISTVSSVGFSIQFNGLVLGHEASGYMQANGSNEFGDSYVATGGPSDKCLAAAQSPASQYRPAN